MLESMAAQTHIIIIINNHQSSSSPLLRPHLNLSTHSWTFLWFIQLLPYWTIILPLISPVFTTSDHILSSPFVAFYQLSNHVKRAAVLSLLERQNHRMQMMEDSSSYSPTLSFLSTSFSRQSKILFNFLLFFELRRWRCLPRLQKLIQWHHIY